MAYEWGKYINGEVFIEDPIIINNGNIISTEELENKENFNIKQIKYASVMKKYVEEIYNAICNKYSLLPFC